MTAGLDAYLIEAVDRWPDRDAFRCRGETITYAALAKRARAMAARLAALGVGRGDRVAIGMTKGLEMPVAIHAAWMNGAAFVPLDLSLPAERLADIVETSDVTVLIGAQRDAVALSRLVERRDVKIVGADIEGAGEEPSDGVGDSFVPAVNGPDDVAYIMFTSGSTGAPKGLVHTHGSGRAFAEMWAALYGLRGDDVLFCTVPLHFDFCLADFLAIPLAGACTELVPEAVQRFPASLAAELERSGATIWSTVPYALIQLQERGALDQRDLSHLRLVIFGGEPFSPRHLAEVRAVIPATYSNSYGPAEVNQVTEYTVPADHPVEQAIPIGRPTDHAKLAMDEHGELLVAAPSMMHGYWRRPDLDARVFVERDGQRYYRTGDLVALGDDGLWRFAGRADRQIKLRGYRVELDEVEMVLAAHPKVSEAAVVMAADRITLNAYVTSVPGSSVAIKTLRAHVASRLPPYAVPASITLRETFPRTGSGKINRRALAEETT